MNTLNTHAVFLTHILTHLNTHSLIQNTNTYIHIKYKNTHASKTNIHTAGITTFKLKHKLTLLHTSSHSNLWPLFISSEDCVWASHPSEVITNKHAVYPPYGSLTDKQAAVGRIIMSAIITPLYKVLNKHKYCLFPFNAIRNCIKK